MATNNNITLNIEELGFAYNKDAQIFSDINFNLDTGQILNILGPNGCGKTTLLNCIIGLYDASVGNIIIDCVKTSKMSDKQIAKNLGYVTQNINAVFDYKVIEYVVCGCAPHLKLFKRPGKKHYEAAYKALEQLGIQDLADKSYTQISGGEQQQASIARVLTQKPKFILLDEPTSHLDFGNQVHVLKIIKQMAEQGFGIIMTTHNPDHAMMVGGKTLMMHRNGSYKYGNTEDIVTEESLKNLYGIDIYLEMSKNAKRKTCVAPSI